MENKKPTIDDYKDIMQQFESGTIDGFEWKIIVFCDKDGNSEFMDNFYKEMVNAAKNFDYEKFKKDNDEKTEDN